MSNGDKKNEAQDRLLAAGIKRGIYQHTDQGGLYLLFATSVDERTLALKVHYYSFDHDTRWTRDAEDFFGHSTMTPTKLRFVFMRRPKTAELLKAIDISVGCELAER